MSASLVGSEMCIRDSSDSSCPTWQPDGGAVLAVADAGPAKLSSLTCAKRISMPTSMRTCT
eukprot:1937492-Alexandrium_andersonii.AAC.1